MQQKNKLSAISRDKKICYNNHNPETTWKEVFRKLLIRTVHGCAKYVRENGEGERLMYLGSTQFVTGCIGGVFYL